ncbi:glutathione S-transferase family protein [Solimonas terrae]|uniref:Glutathione S-transferase family protein n=1 Tax=Solimonas terrae TaxID=1396819 RepID=A0A6M2BQJ9_9GAMM|nr:glutathione S-transferase family protein [Solimonas terrae]NGY04343.1 glutathione S-transferase family protein [Solimonas terrae]
MITLYHCQDARSLRCLWALEELQLPYELKAMAFPPRVHAPELLSLHPTGTVPLLLDGEQILFESAACLEYLACRDRSRGLAVASDDPHFGAWLNWLHFGEASLTTPLATMMRYAHFEPEPRRQPAVVADHRTIFLDRLQLVERALQDREYLVADRFTVADISVGYAFVLARMLKLLGDLSPALQAYWGRLQQRPAYLAARAAQKVAMASLVPAA